MSLRDPDITTSEPFTNYLQEGETFTLLGIRIIENVQTKEFGSGDMVVLDVRLANGEQKSLGVWGTYLLAQADAAEESDFPGQYQMVRKVVPGFSDRPVKMLDAVTETESPI